MGFNENSRYVRQSFNFKNYENIEGLNHISLIRPSGFIKGKYNGLEMVPLFF